MPKSQKKKLTSLLDQLEKETKKVKRYLHVDKIENEPSSDGSESFKFQIQNGIFKQVTNKESLDEKIKQIKDNYSGSTPKAQDSEESILHRGISVG